MATFSGGYLHALDPKVLSLTRALRSSDHEIRNYSRAEPLMPEACLPKLKKRCLCRQL